MIIYMTFAVFFNKSSAIFPFQNLAQLSLLIRAYSSVKNTFLERPCSWLFSVSIWWKLEQFWFLTIFWYELIKVKQWIGWESNASGMTKITLGIFNIEMKKSSYPQTCSLTTKFHSSESFTNLWGGTPYFIISCDCGSDMVVILSKICWLMVLG